MPPEIGRRFFASHAAAVMRYDWRYQALAQACAFVSPF
jgi:hypothetical protein